MAKKSIGVIVDEPPVSSIEPSGDAGSNDGGIPDTPESTGEPELINGFEPIEPTSIDTGAGSGTGGRGRRRGRPAGSTNRRTAKENAKSNLSGLEGVLLSLHAMGAAFFATPELMLAEEEAKTLADAAANVASHYDHKINPRNMAWVNLAMVAGTIYGTRFVAVRARLKEESGKKVVPMRPQTVERQARTDAGPAPRSPADMFGLDYHGAIPDAM